MHSLRGLLCFLGLVLSIEARAFTTDQSRMPAIATTSSGSSLTETAPEPTPATLHNRGQQEARGASHVTIHVINSMDRRVTAEYHSAVPATGDPVPLHHATNGEVWQPRETKSVVMPHNFSGMAVFGVDGVNAWGSKWEASFMATPNYVPHIDVSYVDGYSVPITCACALPSGNVEVVTGCNLELWELEICTPGMHHGRCCPNPMRRSPKGPAHQFFHSCAGSAYTFPKDDTADSGCPGTTEITCCLGRKCPPARLQRVVYAHVAKSGTEVLLKREG